MGRSTENAVAADVRGLQKLWQSGDFFASWMRSKALPIGRRSDRVDVCESLLHQSAVPVNQPSLCRFTSPDQSCAHAENEMMTQAIVLVRVVDRSSGQAFALRIFFSNAFTMAISQISSRIANWWSYFGPKRPSRRSRRIAAVNGHAEQLQTRILLTAGAATTADQSVFDIDGDGQFSPFQDAVLLFAWMSEGTPDSVIENFIGANATRRTSAAVIAHLNAHADELDIDCNGLRNPFQDAVLIFAWMSPGTPDSTFARFIGSNAIPPRNSATGIRNYLGELNGGNNSPPNPITISDFGGRRDSLGNDLSGSNTAIRLQGDTNVNGFLGTLGSVSDNLDQYFIPASVISGSGNLRASSSMAGSTIEVVDAETREVLARGRSVSVPKTLIGNEGVFLRLEGDVTGPQFDAFSQTYLLSITGIIFGR